jgi:beta-galactosidase
MGFQASALRWLAGACVVVSAGGGTMTEAASATTPREIEDTQCLGINKEPAHATLMPYGSLKEALAGRRHASSFCRSLNGDWKFNYVPRPEQRPVDFYKQEFDVSAWKVIPVPSNWQVLGYGTPYYRNAGYTIQKNWPHVMSEPPKDWTAYEERNPVGSYRRDFILPPDWDGRQVFLTFDGVDSAFFLWINGQPVGYSVNSRNAAEFDVTKVVKPGSNMVAVEVYRYSSGTWLEDQDMFRLSGIFRNVSLWSAPRLHVRDFFVKTSLDAQYKDATLEVTAKVKNYSNQEVQGRKLVVDLYDGDHPVSGVRAEAAVPALKPGSEAVVTLKVNVRDPGKWTAETPRLYTATLGLVEGPQVFELLSSRVGFRTIEIRGRQFLVNGTPIKLKGANRHEHWPDVGHAITEAQMIRDLEVLKQGNCNHVRTCHYSDDPRWYELCDEYGIWLVAEANVECHGYDHKFDNEPLMKDAIVDRNVANTENFKNHPSVIIWSLGNECGGRGSNFIAAMEAIRVIDPTRPVHYERFGIGEGNPADLDSRMYTHPAQVEKIANDSNMTKPFYLCEYAHAMFNSMGAIGEYNDLFDKYPALLGGAIWEWQDQGLWNRRDPKHPILAYGGGFGEKPNDHYFIHKGVVAADRSPKPHYPEMKQAYQWIGIEPADLAAGMVKIRNRYQFISLGGFRAKWSLSCDGRQIEQGTLKLPEIAPGAEATLSVPCRVTKPRPGSEYFLRLSFVLDDETLWAKRGTELAAAQFKLPIAVPEPVIDISMMKPLALVEDDKAITVTGVRFVVAFDRASGQLSRLERDGVSLLAANGSPKLHLWRAPHRNDDMWAMKGWEENGLNALKFSPVSLSAKQSQPTRVVVEAVVKAEGKNGFSARHAATLTILGDGSITVDNDIAFEGPRIALARIGVRMMLDRKLDRFEYFGRGPMENYADRKRGFDVGLYGSSVKEQQTPYEKPMECGNHEDVRWAMLTGWGMPGLKVLARKGLMQVSALPYTDEQMTPVEYKIDLPPSTATVLCLSTKTLGVGSNGCGPKPLDAYMVWPEPTKFSYTMQLLR